MEPLKSNLWSSETLVRGMANVASQPFALLSVAVNQDDADLREEFLEPKLNILVRLGVTTFIPTNKLESPILSPVHHIPQHSWFWQSDPLKILMLGFQQPHVAGGMIEYRLVPRKALVITIV